MAVDSNDTKHSPEASAGRRFAVGTNVIVATVLVIAIVVVVQAIAYSIPMRGDMTSSGINSLSDATESLLRSLDTNVRVTSLYFETDREEADQSRYRQAVRDLIDLYEATNRSKVIAEWVNPLKDHEKFRGILGRLHKMTVFASQVSAYKQRIDVYSDDLDARMRKLIQTEISSLGELGGPMTDDAGQRVIAPIQRVLGGWPDQLEAQRDRLDVFVTGDTPQYSAAIDELRRLYRELGKLLKDISEFGSQQVQANPGLPAPYVEFLAKAGNRYADLMADVEGEKTALEELEPLEVDDLVGKLAPTGNSILVETGDDAMVVDFASVWPPIREGSMGRAGFDQRAFKGEEKLTSAILRATHKEQTAVVFVRYGGTPLFFGRFMPGQPPAPYSAMKQQLEDANFIVEEWDVKSRTTPPDIDPEPTRTIYVVLKPAPPQRGPMGQPSQEPPFGETHRRSVLAAIGKDGRALFIAGWQAGPFGLMASTYEFNDYLSNEWGINIDTSALLVETMSQAPGKYVVARRDFYAMRDPDVGDHAIVSGATARQLVLPLCARLELADVPPDGVELTPLVIMPPTDGIWGEKNVQELLSDAQSQQPFAPGDDDLTGPFDLAVAGTKGDAKVVVVSSEGFAVDNVAFARGMAITAQGLVFRSLNPGNVSLVINSLHWLNDNTEFMNIGNPIDPAVLKIEDKSTVRTVRIVTIALWPALALVCGCVVWWIRRR